MSAVLATTGVKHIDYMVIDTEGNEPQIIASIDFSAVQIDYLMVECNDCLYRPDGVDEMGVPTCNQQRQLRKLLHARGYVEALFIQPIDIIYRRKTNLDKA